MIKEVNIEKSKVIFPAVSNSYFMFHYGDTYKMRLKNLNEVDFFPVTLSGISTMYSTFIKEGIKIRFVGAELQPFTPYLLLDKQVKNLTNKTIDATLLFSDAQNIHQEIKNTSPGDEMIPIMNRFFTNLFSSKTPYSGDLVEAVEIMANPKEFETIDSRLNRIDENTRNFRRKFKNTLGLSPKLYARILRMEKVLKELYQDTNMDYISKMHGFYDQSHLIRECKYFSGRTPKMIIQAFQDSQIRKYHPNLINNLSGEKTM